MSQLVVAVTHLGDADQSLRAVEAFDTVWHVGLILVGVHLLLIGCLAHRSGFISKIIGVLLVVAGHQGAPDDGRSDDGADHERIA